MVSTNEQTSLLHLRSYTVTHDDEVMYISITRAVTGNNNIIITKNK